MRPQLPPRLSLVSPSDRPASWVIRHGQKFIRTGALEHETDRANRLLADYLQSIGHIAGLSEDMGPPRPKAATPSIIYFITCEAPDFPIKIGIASHLARRVAQMQNALPFPVVVLAEMPGLFLHERTLVSAGWARRSVSIEQATPSRGF